MSSNGKLVTHPKATYPLSIENLSDLVAYSPNATHPDSLISKVDLPAGALFATITAATNATSKAWSTVQISKDQHVELNSALMYMNHACSPSVELDVGMMEVRVSGRDLKVGDEITFWYPSTEWKMEEPFKCLCTSESCLGVITGAADIGNELLKKWFANEHIIKLKSEQNDRYHEEKQQ